MRQNARNGLVLGLDVGGTSIKGVFGVMRGGGGEHESVEWVVRAQSAAYTKPTVEHVRAALRDLAAELMHSRDGAERVGAVGLCVPGVVEPTTQRVSASVNMPGLVGVSLRELAAEAVGTRGVEEGLKVSVVGDALAAAEECGRMLKLAEHERLMAVALGTGVGMVVLDGQQQLLVNPGTSGHFGQIDVSLDRDESKVPIGPDGGRGSLEAYIGLAALKARYGEGEQLRRALERITVDDDPIRALVRGLRVVLAIYKPRVVALLGGVGTALGQAAVARELQGAVSRDVSRVVPMDWRLEFAADGFYSARGAGNRAARGI
ncbi:MAG: ROK family protein [Phycisphaerales bacterium]|nr:ROK family protein [Phycisphaerales bacterium]